MFEKIKKIFWKPSSLLIIIPLAIYFSFGLYHIGEFETADEHYWVYSPSKGRVQQYWNAIAQRNWSDTYINDKPGVTVALISGSGLFFKNSDVEINEYERQKERISKNDPEISSGILSLYKIPIVIFNGIFSLFFLWSLWKITKNKWIALWGWLLILFSPVLIGISQIVNPDSLLWSFSTATLLSFLIMLETKKKKYILITALFLGLSLLTKYTALLLIPFMFVSGTAYFWFNFDSLEKKFNKQYFRFIVSTLAVVIGAVVVFVIFVPGIFTKYSTFFHGVRMVRDKETILLGLIILILFSLIDLVLLKSRLMIIIFKKTQPFKNLTQKVIYSAALILIILVIINWISKIGIVFPKIYSVRHDLERGIGFRNRDNFSQLILNLRSTLFSVSPMVLLGILILLAQGISKKIKNSFLVIYLGIFLIAFYMAVIQQDLLITYRYGIMVYPVVAILAAVGFCETLNVSKWKALLFTFILLITSIISVWSVAPFYFNYSSSLLYKDQVIADAWGYGGYEAAQYLNGLPDAENIKVWADYRGFCAFFRGTCIRERSVSSSRDNTAQYFIKTRRGSIIFPDRWDNLEESYIGESAKPIWELDINGKKRNFVKIYKKTYETKNDK